MGLSPGTRLGPYEVISPLGAGGMGEVYKARDTRLERVVALKVLPEDLAGDAERRARLEREARAVSSLNHPHICTLHDVGEQDGVVFLVLEHLEGQTLAERLQKGPLPTDQVLRFGAEIADGLERAHRQGIVHRDLKPGNIMLTRTGAKLLDFGLARLDGQESAAADVSKLATRAKPLTGDGTLLGTFQYMAPEQLEGKPADARTDIFALGAVLYEMATGRRAFEAKSQASLVAAILEHEPQSMTSLQPLTPAALERLVKVCLAKDPDDRLQTAHDVMQELKWIAEAGPSAAGAARPRRATAERLAWLAGLALSGAAMFVVGSRVRAPALSAPIRFAIPPEKGTELDQSIALSPDGRRLAFTARDASGERRLYVRPLEALGAMALAGTEGARFPFWSPDGRHLAFFARHQLVKVEATGGPVQTLCEAPEGRGGTWNPEGVVLFAPDSRSSLSRVAAQGGVPSPVTTVDPGRSESTHRWPHFLPDGRHFLFCNYAGREETRGIYVGSLDGKERRRILPDCSVTAYAPSGHVLFVRDGAVLAQAFDADRLELRGEPFSVASPAWSAFSDLTGLTALTASTNGILAYRGGGPARSRLGWLDRAGRALGELGSPADYYDLSLSKDGRQVAVSRGDAQGVDHIWLFDLGRGVSSRLTLAAAEQYVAVWSPDGSEVFFSSNAGGAYDIYRQPVNAAAGQFLLVSSGTAASYPLDVSPDGRLLLYQALGRTTGNDIWSIPLSGEGPPVAFLEGPFSESGARFSPDGRFVAYESNESGRHEVYVQAFPVPSGKWQISATGGGQVEWRRDGKEIFYASPDGNLMAVAVKSVGSRFEAGTPQVLFRARDWTIGTGAESHQYAVTPDGQRFLILMPVEDPGARVVNVVLNWHAGLKVNAPGPLP